MPLQPDPGKSIKINDLILTFIADPKNPRVVLQRSGSHSTVYQLSDTQTKLYALKVFDFAWRSPFYEMQASVMAPYANISGLSACERILIIPTDNAELVIQHPELRYAVLMPWLKGQTWKELKSSKADITRKQRLLIAQALARTLAAMEQSGIAHCNLSPANILVNISDSDHVVVHLVDLEGMFIYGLAQPEKVLFDEQAYAHPADTTYTWGPVVDRYAGAQLIIEILSEDDEKGLQTTWGDELSRLSEQVSNSDAPASCPTFFAWQTALQKVASHLEPVSRAEKLIEPPRGLPEPEVKQQTIVSQNVKRKVYARGWIIFFIIALLGSVVYIGDLSNWWRYSGRSLSHPTPAVSYVATPTDAPAITTTPTLEHISNLAFDQLFEPHAFISNNSGRWESFQKASVINDLVVKDGLIWAATNGGVFVWDILTENYKHYTVLDGLGSNIITTIDTDGDLIYAGCDERGIYAYLQSEWFRFVSGPNLEIIGKTADGIIWLYDQRNASLYEYRDKELIPYLAGEPPLSVGFGYPVVSFNHELWSSAIDTDGNYLMLHQTNNTWESIAHGLPGDDFRILGITPEDKLWLVDENGNIYIHDGDESNFITTIPLGRFDSLALQDGSILLSIQPSREVSTSIYWKLSPDGIVTDLNDLLPAGAYVTALYSDDDNNIWLGTNHGVISIGEDQTVKSIYPLVEDNSIGLVEDSVVASDGSIWLVDFSNKIYSIDGALWNSYELPQEISTNSPFQTITISSDRSVWVGEWWESGRVIKYHDDQWTLFGVEEGLDSGGYVWDIRSFGNFIWAATHNGLAMFDGSRWNMYLTGNDFRSVAISDNGTVYAGEYSGNIYYSSDADYQNWSIFTEESGHPVGSIPILAFDMADALYVGTHEGLQKLADNNWEEIHGSPDHVNDIDFGIDGSIWVVTEFDGLQKYDGSEWQIYAEGKPLPGLRLHSVSAHPDGSIWIGGDGGLSKYSPLGTDPTLPYSSVAQQATAVAAQSLYPCDGGGSPVIYTFTEQISEDTSFDVRFSPDGSLIAYTSIQPHKLTIVNADNYSTNYEMETNFSSFAFSPQGDQFVFGTGSGDVCLVDLVDYQVISCKTVHSTGLSEYYTDGARVMDITFSPDNNYIVSAGADWNVNVYDSGGDILFTIPHQNLIQAIAIDPFSQLLAVSVGYVNDRENEDRAVYLWDLASGNLVSKLSYPDDHWQNVAESLVFSKDGNLLVSGNFIGSLVWDVNSGSIIERLDGSWGAFDMSFSPIENHVAIGTYDKGQIWDITTGDLLLTICMPTYAEVDNYYSSRGDPSQRGIVYGIDFSPDGRFLVTASGSGLYLWELNR